MTAAAATALLLTLLACLHFLQVARVPGLDPLELSSIDLRFKLRGPEPRANDEIVIVGMDSKLRQRNLDAFLRHESTAAVIRALAGYHPRAVGLDLFLDTADAVLPPPVLADVGAAHAEALAEHTRSRALEHATKALGAVLDESRGDEHLAAALRDAGNVQLASLFFVDPAARRRPRTATVPAGLKGAEFDESGVLDRVASRRPPAAEAVFSSLPVFASAGAGAGQVNVLADIDGRIRRIYGAVEYDGRYFAPLGLTVARTHPSMGGGLGYRTEAESIKAGPHRFPVDERGVLTVNWLGKRDAFPIVSAMDVLDGTAPRAMLEGKLVFVGLTDAARDVITTPFDKEVHGVELHATVAYDALFGKFLRHADARWTVVAALLLGALATVLQARFVRRRGAWIPGAVGALCIAGYALALQIFFARGVILGAVAPMIVCAAATAAALFAALATEERDKRRLREALSNYVSGAVTEKILSDPQAARLGGIRREVSLLFSDIRGFSHFSENLEPDILSAFLSEYFTPMSDFVLEQDGLLDKYVGDAVMAIFGAPLEQPDHADRACRCALRMIAALGPLNAGWAARGLPEVRIGIGINTGTVSVGNMGSARRFNYTAVGDAVNLCSRLETLTKEYKAPILVGERMRLLVGDRFAFRELDRVRVVGREGAVRIFELLGQAGASRIPAGEVARFDVALAAYRRRAWDEAEPLFASLLASRPDDGPVAVFLERVRSLRENPPPADWDGVYRQHSK